MGTTLMADKERYRNFSHTALTPSDSNRSRARAAAACCTTVRAWVEVETGALQRAEVTLIPPLTAKENHVVRVDYEMPEWVRSGLNPEP